MKPKLILLSLLFIFSGYNTEAQLLKRLKKKAEEAAERVLVKKTEEQVAKTTDAVLDSIFSAPSTDKDKQNLPDIEDREMVKTQQTAATKSGETDLGLEKSVDKLVVETSETVTFTVSIRNYGPNNATGVKVKDKLPDGYTFRNADVNSGSYNSNSGLWDIGTLPKGKLVRLTLVGSVLGDGDLMNLAEIINCDQTDPDSNINNGVDTDGDKEVIDDPDDEDDGDGQDVKRKIKSATTSTIKKDGIKAIITDHKKESQTFFFDTNTVAMRIDLGAKKKKQSDLFFDNDGYVYSASNKNEYVKVPFEKLKKMMKFPTFVSGGMLPEIPFPDGTITYYGMDVSPHNFPILEWAWVYKAEYFEDRPELNKETLICRGESNCTKYTLKEGKDAGSYVLFDHKDRLAEINSINSGNAVYTYDQYYEVTLPQAQEMPFMTDMFRN